MSELGRLVRPGSLLAAALSLGVMLLTETAGAFCRSTTCDLKLPPGAAPECAQNTIVNLCSTQGMPLVWPDGCVWFGIEASGSPKLGISKDQLHDVVKAAFAAWTAVDCGGGQHPSLAVADTDELYGSIECATPEFNPKAANANVWLFSDSEWTHPESEAFAITLSTVNIVTGEVYDADVLLNSFGENMAVEPRGDQAKLLNVVTHEVGHYLGLGHSTDPTAMMYGYYSPQRAKLSDDDRDGICAAYPPTRGGACAEPEPQFGFSRYCGGVSPSTLPLGRGGAPAGGSGAGGSAGANAAGSAGAGAYPTVSCAFAPDREPSVLGALLAGVLALVPGAARCLRRIETSARYWRE